MRTLNPILLIGLFLTFSADEFQIPISKKSVNPARVRKDDPDWQKAKREVYAGQAVLDANSKRVGAKLSKFVVRRGNPKQNTVTLTFDDGPHPAYTLKLLDILKAQNVRATFFVIGFMAEKYPNLVRAIKAAGHEVGNHTYSHVTLTKIPSDQALTEYKANNDVIFKLVGTRARYCRPPGGDFNTSVLRGAASLGLTTVLWTDDPGDYSNPGDQKLFDREVSKLHPGGIILLHDGSKNTIDTLAKFIQTTKKKGLRFVSLDEFRAQ